MGYETIRHAFALPEKSSNFVRNWWDLLVINIMLNQHVTRYQTLGSRIQSRGIERKYIVNLCGRYEVISIKQYINALGDRNNQSLDEVVDTNPEYESNRP